MNLSSNHSASVNPRRLFVGMCLAIIPTGASFVFVSNIFQQLKTEFILTNAQVGYIGGAVLWGMALSLLLVGPFLEKIGLKKATVGAFFGHLIGTTLFLAAAPFAEIGRASCRESAYGRGRGVAINIKYNGY